MLRFPEWFKLLICLMFPQVAGGIGALSTRASLSSWYGQLEKPWFTPPSWVFGPVWITLYILMGVSAFLIWRRGWRQPGVRTALGFFGAQLAVNAMWSWVFFGRRSTFGGFMVILVLWALILITMIQFFRVSRMAGILLMPYILWVSFAGVLNYCIYSLNAGR